MGLLISMAPVTVGCGGRWLLLADKCSIAPGTLACVVLAGVDSVTLDSWALAKWCGADVCNATNVATHRAVDPLVIMGHGSHVEQDPLANTE